MPGSEVTPWHLPLGGHMEFTWGRTMREWSNSVRGALLLKPKPFSQLFSPPGQNISCMLIFHRAVVASQSSERAGSLPKARNTYSYSCRCLSSVKWSSFGNPSGTSAALRLFKMTARSLMTTTRGLAPTTKTCIWLLLIISDHNVCTTLAFSFPLSWIFVISVVRKTIHWWIWMFLSSNKWLDLQLLLSCAIIN